MRINPCHGCPAREGCERISEMKDITRRLGAVSVKFTCDRLDHEMRIGRRIMTDVPRIRAHPASLEPEEVYSKVSVPATITGRGGYYEFTCTTDPGTAKPRPFRDEDREQVERRRFLKWRKHTRITRFLDEPDRKVCESGRVLLPGGACDGHPDGRCWCKEAAEALTDFKAA